MSRQLGQRPSLIVRGRLKVSELFPLLSQKRAPLSSAFFGPILLTLALVVILMNGMNDARTPDNVLFVLRAVALWMAVAGLVFFHVLTGRVRPWWWGAAAFSGAALLTILERMLSYPVLGTLRALAPEIGSDTFIGHFLQWLFATTLPEEFFKALPVAAVILYRLRARAPSLLTPIEGALLGAACGAGFTLIEADQYAYMLLHPEARFSREEIELLLISQPEVLVPDQAGAFLQILVRMVGQVSMHAAWTGGVGYYLGLALLDRRHVARLAIGGLLLSACMHALWNTGQSRQSGDVFAWVVAAISYALFASAVLKGLQVDAHTSADRAAEPPAPRPVPAPVVDVVPVSPKATPPSTPVPPVGLHIGNHVIHVRPGDVLTSHQLFAEQTGVDDTIAEVVQNPTDPNIWGLRNRSATAWNAMVKPGDERTIQPGHSVRLATGVTIHCGAATIVVT